MDKLILKQIENDKLLNDESFIMGEGYFLIYPKYLKDLKKIFSITTEEIIEVIEEGFLLKVVVLNPINVADTVSVLMRYDKGLKDFLLAQIKEIKYDWVRKQEYEKAAWFRDLEKKIESIQEE